MNLPENISRRIIGKNYKTDDIGMSHSNIKIFDDSVLKIVKYRRENEKTVQIMRWLEEKLPIPKVVCYERDEEYQYLLMSRMERLCPVIHIIWKGQMN